MPSLPFDHVRLQTKAGRKTLSAKQFLELPLNDRIGHVLHREVEFFKNKAPVERSVALKALRKIAP